MQVLCLSRAPVGHLQLLQPRPLLTQPLPCPVPPAPLPESWPSVTALNPESGSAACWGPPQGECFPEAALSPRHPAWLLGPRWGPRDVGRRSGEVQLSPLQMWPTPTPWRRGHSPARTMPRHGALATLAPRGCPHVPSCHQAHTWVMSQRDGEGEYSKGLRTLLTDGHQWELQRGPGLGPAGSGQEWDRKELGVSEPVRRLGTRDSTPCREPGDGLVVSELGKRKSAGHVWGCGSGLGGGARRP